jgi:hypothetical protein
MAFFSDEGTLKKVKAYKGLQNLPNARKQSISRPFSVFRIACFAQGAILPHRAHDEENHHAAGTNAHTEPKISGAPIFPRMRPAYIGCLTNRYGVQSAGSENTGRRDQQRQ